MNILTELQVPTYKWVTPVPDQLVQCQCIVPADIRLASRGIYWHRLWQFNREHVITFKS